MSPAIGRVSTSVRHNTPCVVELLRGGGMESIPRALTIRFAGDVLVRRFAERPWRWAVLELDGAALGLLHTAGDLATPRALELVWIITAVQALEQLARCLGPVGAGSSSNARTSWARVAIADGVAQPARRRQRSRCHHRAGSRLFSRAEGPMASQLLRVVIGAGLA